MLLHVKLHRSRRRRIKPVGVEYSNA